MEKLTGELKIVKNILRAASNILVFSGAGISAESGIPTFRGTGGLWRKYDAASLATPQAFQRESGLVWEFYHYRRELVMAAKPNLAHIALAKMESICSSENKSFTLVTQNVDNLHERAGSKNVMKLHGSLFDTICTKCGDKKVNMSSPICKGLERKALLDVQNSRIPPEDLPECDTCGGLLRPGVVWFGESLDPTILEKVDELVNKCDVCLVIGTSSVVYPAAGYAPRVVARGKPVIEFNIEDTPASSAFKYNVLGPCAQTLPLLLD